MNDSKTAMQMELEAERCYRKLAEANEHTAMAQLFNLLADESVKQYERLRRRHCGEPDECEHGSVREEIGELFRRMLVDGVDVPDDVALVLRYRVAQELEDRTIAHYARMAAQAESEPVRDFLRGMLAEDILHKQVLESVIQFVTEPVHDGWLEKAKWLSDASD